MSPVESPSRVHPVRSARAPAMAAGALLLALACSNEPVDEPGAGGSAGISGSTGTGGSGNAAGTGSGGASGGASQIGGSGGVAPQAGSSGSSGAGGSGNAAGEGSGGAADGGAGAASGGGGSAGSLGGAGAASGGTAGSAGGAAGQTFVYVSGPSSTLRVFEFTAASGTLQPSSMSTEGGSNPNYLAFNPNGKFMYAVNESNSSSKLLAFSIDASGALKKLTTNGEAAASPGQGPAHIAVDASGTWIFTAHFSSGHTSVHPILANGGIGTMSFIGKTAAEAHQVRVDPTGKFLIVPCRTPNVITQYRIDSATGMLTPNEPATITAPTAGTGPRHIAFHPNGKWAYVLGELNGHVIFYAYDGTTGLLSNPQEISTQTGETSAAHILVHPNGRFAFASLRKSNEITTLAIDATTGRVTATAHQTSMISGPRDFTIDPSGQFLLVANEGSGSVTVLGIDATSGALTMRSNVATDGLAKPQFIGAITLP